MKAQEPMSLQPTINPHFKNALSRNPDTEYDTAWQHWYVENAVEKGKGAVVTEGTQDNSSIGMKSENYKKQSNS